MIGGDGGDLFRRLAHADDSPPKLGDELDRPKRLA
jgi:hypothetical protein